MYFNTVIVCFSAAPILPSPFMKENHENAYPTHISNPIIDQCMKYNLSKFQNCDFPNEVLRFPCFCQWNVYMYMLTLPKLLYTKHITPLPHVLCILASIILYHCHVLSMEKSFI